MPRTSQFSSSKSQTRSSKFRIQEMRFNLFQTTFSKIANNYLFQFNVMYLKIDAIDSKNFILIRIVRDCMQRTVQYCMYVCMCARTFAFDVREHVFHFQLHLKAFYCSNTNIYVYTQYTHRERENRFKQSLSFFITKMK